MVAFDGDTSLSSANRAPGRAETIATRLAAAAMLAAGGVFAAAGLAELITDSMTAVVDSQPGSPAP